MSEGRIPRFHGERGATLILAIAFMVVIGGIGAAVVSSVTSGFKGRIVLDQVRNRQYAADAGVESAIAQVRALPLPGPGKAPCGPDTPPHYNSSLNGFNIRVDCANQFGQAATPTGIFVQLNVIFTACVDTGSPCVDVPVNTPNPPANATVVRAQINYEAKSAGTVLNVTRTWVQSWSVNR